MADKDTKAYLHHILDSIRKIESFVGLCSREEFFADDMRLSAVLREFEVIGEAARQMSELYKREHPEVEWELMVGMLNALIHHYFGVNEDVVWKTYTEDLPRLKDKVTRLLPA